MYFFAIYWANTNEATNLSWIKLKKI